MAKVGPDEDICQDAVCYFTGDEGAVYARLMVEFEPGIIGFFLPGYKANESLLVNGEEVMVPGPGLIDERLARHHQFPYSEGKKRVAWTWSCGKCGANGYETVFLHGHSGGMAAFVDLTDLVFRVVSCRGCGFCEIYKE